MTWNKMILFALAAPLAAVEPFYDREGDWELACDNAAVCRAAGYASEEEAEAWPLSLLLSQEKHERTPGVQLQIQAEALPGESIRWFIGERPQAELPWAETIAFPEAQAEALFQALASGQVLSFEYRGQRVRLSTAGLNSILEKMNDYLRQAVIQPLPEIRIPPLDADGQELPRTDAVWAKLRPLLEQEDCTAVDDGYAAPQRYDLGSGRQLLEIPCRLSAYNALEVYFIWESASGRLQPLPQPFFNAHYRQGLLHSTAKLRGLGDCWLYEAWAWNGKDFVLAEKSGTEMCRGFVGGAWDLPQRQSLIIQE